MAKGAGKGGGNGPSKEDVTIASQMAGLISQMASQSSRISASFESQAEATAKMAENMKSMGTGDIVTQLLHVTLKEVAAALSSLNETASAAFAGIAAGAGDAASATAQLTDASLKAAEAAAKETTSMEDLQKKLRETGKNALSAKQKMAALGDYFEKEFPVATGAALGAMSGLAQGFKNVMALGKGMFGIGKAVVSSLFSIGRSIITLPFKMLDKLTGMANQGGSISELSTAINNLRKEFGALGGPVASAIQSTASEMKGFNVQGLSSMQVFGNVAERMEQLTKLFAAGGPSLQKFSGEFKDNGGAILGFQKGLGITDEQLGALAERADTAGTSISSSLLDMTKQATHLGKEFGVDFKVISKGMAKATADFKNFGSMSQKQIGVAVTYFAKLGVQLDKVTGVMDSFNTFDDAAEKVSTLNQVFGTNVDSMKMMNAENPAERVAMLQKEFAKAGISGEKLTRAQRQLIASNTGMSEDAVAQAFSTKNQSVSLDKMTKSGETAAKTEMTQAQALNKLGDAMDRVLKSAESRSGGFFDQFLQGISSGITTTKEFRDLMKNLKGSLNVVWLEGKRLGKGFVDSFPGVKDFLGGLTDIFQPAKFKKLVGGTVDVFIGFFKDLESGKASFPDLMIRLKKHFFDFFDSEKGAGQKVMGGFKKIMMAIQVILAGGIKWIMESIGGFIRNIVNFIKNPTGFGGGVGDVASAYISPIGQAFRDGWKILGPALGDLFNILFKKLGEIIVPKVKAFASEYWPVLAGILFGPVAFRAMLGAGTAVFSKAIGGMISKAFSGPDTQSLILKEMKGLNSVLSRVPAAPTGIADAANGIGAATNQAPGLAAASAASPGINWAAIGTFLIGFAGVMAIGLLTFYIAAQMVEDMDKETIIKALAVTLAMAIAAVPVAFAMQILSKMPPTSPSVLIILGSLALAMIGLAVLGAAIVTVTAGMSMGDVAAGMLLMIGMSVATVAVAAALSLLIPGAEVIKAGAPSLLPALGVVGLAMLGLAALGVIIVAIASLFSPTSIENGLKLILGMAIAAMLVSLSMAAIMAAGSIGLNPVGMAGLGAGFIAIGLAIVGLGVLAGAMVAALGGVDIAAAKNAGDIVWETAKIVGIAALAVGALTLVGGGMISSFGLAGLALLVGLVAVGAVIGDENTGLVWLSLTIVKGIKDMPSDIAEKAKAFASIMDAIAKIAQVIPDTLEAMDLGFFTSHDQQVEKIKSVTTMIEDLLGTRGGSGLIGMIEIILAGLKAMTPAQVEAAKAIGPLLQGVAGIAAAFGGVSSSMGEAFKNIDDDEFEKLGPIIEKVGLLTDKIAQKIPEVIRGIIPLITMAEGSKINIEGVKAIGAMVGSLGPIAQAIAPPPSVMSALAELSKHTGSDEGAMMNKVIVYVGKMATVLIGDGTKESPGLISTLKGAVTTIIQELAKVTISESAMKGLVAIGPILSTMVSFAEMTTGKSMELIMKLSEKPDVKNPNKADNALKSVVRFTTDTLNAMATSMPPLVSAIGASLNTATNLTPEQVKVLEPVGKILQMVIGLATSLIPTSASSQEMPPPSAIAAVSSIFKTTPTLTTILKEMKAELPDLIDVIVGAVSKINIKDMPGFMKKVEAVAKIFEILPKITELGKMMGMASDQAGTLSFSQEQGKKLAFSIDAIAWGILAISNAKYYHEIGGVGRPPLQFFIEEFGSSSLWTKAAQVNYKQPEAFFNGIKKVADAVTGAAGGISATDEKGVAEKAYAKASFLMILAQSFDKMLFSNSAQPAPIPHLINILDKWEEIAPADTILNKSTVVVNTFTDIETINNDIKSILDRLSVNGPPDFSGFVGIVNIFNMLTNAAAWQKHGGELLGGKGPIEQLVTALQSSVWSKVAGVKEQFSAIGTFLGSIVTLSETFEELSAAMPASADAAYENIANSIEKMLTAIIRIDEAMSGTHGLNINTTLKKFKANFGMAMGSQGSTVVKSKDVTINVNFVVAIDATKLEGAILASGNSKIQKKVNLVIKAINEMDAKGVGADQTPAAPLGAFKTIKASNGAGL